MLPRHDAHIFGKELAELDTSGVVRRYDAKAARQRFRRHRGKGFESRRQHEEIRSVVVARKLVVVDEAEQRDGAFERKLSDRIFELSAGFAFSRNEELGVGEFLEHERHGLHEKTLARQRMKPLDVEKKRAFDAERLACFSAFALARRAKTIIDRWIDDRGMFGDDAELDGALEQQPAVKSHMLGVLVHPQERIDPARLVVPYFRSVMREDIRQTPSAGDGRGRLVHERVAVDVHDVHALKRFARFGANRKPRR